MVRSFYKLWSMVVHIVVGSNQPIHIAHYNSIIVSALFDDVNQGSFHHISDWCLDSFFLLIIYYFEFIL